MILCIESSSQNCSVALWHQGRVAGLIEEDTPRAHASLLSVFVERLLAQAGISPRELDAVAASAGPGSYTGLRIGVSLAKGIAFGAGVPLLAVDTLASLAHHAGQAAGNPPGALFYPTVDAGRTELFAGIYDGQGRALRAAGPEFVEQEPWMPQLGQGPLVVLGSGAPKCEQAIRHPNASFRPEVLPSASHLGPLAQRALEAGQLADLAYFEPLYLKAYVAKLPSKNVFR